jgi:hypothetical protein
MRKPKKGIFTAFLMVFVLFSALFGAGHEKTALTEPTGNSLFKSNHIAKINILIKDSDWQDFQANALSKQYVRANFIYDGQICENVAVRTKGQGALASSIASGRLPLKIDFNFFNSKKEFLGIKKLCLNNCSNDPSFMREVLGYWLFEKMGIPTPKNAFADVWVNDTHLGLYTMVEQIDKLFLHNHFTSAKGDLYEAQGKAGTLNWTKKDINSVSKNNHPKVDLNINVGGARLGRLVTVLQKEGFNGSGKLLPEANQSPYAENKNNETRTTPAAVKEDLLSQMSLKTNENTCNNKALFRLLDVLNNCPDKSFPTEIAKVLNVDQVLRFLAVSVLMVHMDNYIGSGQNYYLYEDKGKFSLIPWDLNEAFGGYKAGIPGYTAQLNIDFLVSCSNKPLAARLLAHKPYLQKYHQYIEQLLEGPFAQGRIEAQIDEIASMISPFVKADERKFCSLDDFNRSIGLDSTVESSRPASSQTKETKVPPLKEFIRQRRLSANKQLLALRSAKKE